MSGASMETSLSSEVGKEKSVIWLGTFYLDLTPHSIASMTRDVIWKSESFRPAYVDILLQFQFVRISENDFHLTCFRYHGTSDGSNTPASYTLQYQCSINHFSDETPKVFEMQSDEFVIIERFALNAFHYQFCSPDDLAKPFEFKILVKMIEYDCLPSGNSQQNEYLYQLRDQWFNFTSVLQDLCYILEIPRFENIYTGRQNLAFSDEKSIYIKNAAHYAKEIADYLRAKEACVPVPVTDLGLIVNFVLHGKRESITDELLFEGYILGHLMGLNFVVKLTRDLITMRLPKNVQWVNHGFLIDALRVADRVNDGCLFEIAAKRFQKWERELDNPEALFDLLKGRGIKGRFMLYTLTRRSRRIAEGAHRAVEIGETSQSSSSPASAAFSTVAASSSATASLFPLASTSQSSDVKFSTLANPPPVSQKHTCRFEDDPDIVRHIYHLQDKRRANADKYCVKYYYRKTGRVYGSADIFRRDLSKHYEGKFDHKKHLLDFNCDRCYCRQ